MGFEPIYLHRDRVASTPSRLTSLNLCNTSIGILTPVFLDRTLQARADAVNHCKDDRVRGIIYYLLFEPRYPKYSYPDRTFTCNIHLHLGALLLLKPIRGIAPASDEDSFGGPMGYRAPSMALQVPFPSHTVSPNSFYLTVLIVSFSFALVLLLLLAGANSDLSAFIEGATPRKCFSVRAIPSNKTTSYKYGQSTRNRT